jgi:methylenetetrahydrofolate reductase (NADPH)
LSFSLLKQLRYIPIFDKGSRLTEKGLQNLYDRMERMAIVGPQFIDVYPQVCSFGYLIVKVTWNAGGRVGTLSCEIVKSVQSEIGVESCLHLVYLPIDL